MTVQALCTSLLSCCLEINTDFSGKRKKSDYNSYCLFNLTKCKHFTAVLQIIGNRGTLHRLPCWLLFEVLGRLFLCLKGSGVIAYTCRVRGALHLHAHQKSNDSVAHMVGSEAGTSNMLSTCKQSWQPFCGVRPRTPCVTGCVPPLRDAAVSMDGIWAGPQRPGAAPCRFLFSAASGIWTQITV